MENLTELHIIVRTTGWYLYLLLEMSRYYLDERIQGYSWWNTVVRM